MSQPVRVRFAPSPTGYLHVGGARTALYNYLFAKHHGGQFILRVEDTDLERSTEEALRYQLGDLKWLKLFCDEGVDFDTLESKGEFGPYRQSQRLDIYKRYANHLLESGLAYYDFRTDEELEKIKQASEAYARIPRPESLPTVEEGRERIAKGESAAIRFKVDGGKDHIIDDLVRGEVRLPEDMVGDFILVRSNGMPVYNFCCVIDDALMKISHVFRAEEHLSNTLRQKMVYEALGFDLPQFGHLSLILGSDKQKLSKRHGATSCHQYREKGYLPHALLNFVSLLGWSPGDDQELLSMEQLIEKFDGSRLQTSGAVFDEEKFLWMNSMHLREMPNQELWGLIQPLLAEHDIKLPETEDFVDKALGLFKPKMETLEHAIDLFRPIDSRYFEVSEDCSEVFSWETSKTVFSTWRDELKSSESLSLSAEEFAEIQNTVKSKAGVKGKQLFMPIRIAVIGKPQGADIKLLTPLIDRQSLLERVEKVMDAIGIL